MAKSICSKGKPVTFYWRGGIAGLHIDCAVEELMKAIQKPERVPNRYADTLHRDQFKRRLRAAARGGLVVSDKETPIKAIQRPEAHLFEIRWQDILVDDRDPVSWQIKPRRAALVRLYYLEPVRLGWVVGLHAHEKIIIEDDGETQRLQDEQIDVAVERATTEGSEGWAVPELAGQDFSGRIR